MLTLYYAPGACSLAAHIVMEEVGHPYRPHRMNLGQGEQKTADYLRIHPLGSRAGAHPGRRHSP